MIIRVFLKLFFAALIILVIADIFYELHLNWISNLIVKLGDDLLLLSFILLLIVGIIFFSKQIFSEIKNYFSETERAKRLLFFTIAKNEELQRLFVGKKRQLLYFTKFKKQALLAKNNKKQCHLLSKVLLKELKAVQDKISQEQFKQYQQAIKKASSQQQFEWLLQLQREISTTK